ncbi:hypothetical protein [Agaribacterium haliotis]|uniref:hypothetical protein n=1 Tax=Agaribacterium haliotis TaxID=2013869 RepID=UPI000BB542B0|nr:hypothetical protein [Agaribacterium haliotis]
MKYAPALLCTGLYTGLCLLSSLATADIVYRCENGDQSREVKVIYDDPANTVPCEVRYEKSGGSQILWQAQSEEGYCEQKAQEFVGKQESWGWSCSKMETVVTPASSDE